jgi:hypothetical protein
MRVLKASPLVTPRSGLTHFQTVSRHLFSVPLNIIPASAPGRYKWSYSLMSSDEILYM